LLLSNLIKEELIILNLSSRERMGAIKEMIDRLKEAGKIASGIDFLNIIAEREQLKTTGIGDGVAIPHARTNAVGDLVIAFGRSREGIDFKSIDGQPVHLIFMLASPAYDASRYLNALARICTLLRQKSFRESLIEAENVRNIMEAIKEAETTGKRENVKI